jgi:regulatory protein
VTEEETAQFTAACSVAEKLALRLIGRAEQNSLALAIKLEKRGFEAVVAKEVILRLLDRNLLDDARYAELWIRSRLSCGKKLSPLRLLSSLAKRGIDRESSQKALKNALDPEAEYSMLLNYVKKSNTSKKEKTWIQKSKLKMEGFSPAVLDRYFILS